jgi:photosystem II stability/assembly factor-like uncharacterized protein
VAFCRAERFTAFVRLAFSSAAVMSALVAAAGAGATGLHARPPSTEFDALLVLQADPSALLLGTQHGLYRTTNGGRTWTQSGLGTASVTSLVQSGQEILAGGRGLLSSSSDGGATWTALHPRGLPDEQIAALTADPSNSAVVYVVLSSGGLFRSTDRARSFTLVSRRVGPAIRSLAIGSRGVLAGDVTSGIYVSPNGRVWRHTAGGMVMAFAVDPGRRANILAATFGISRSSDGGLRWKSVLPSHAMFGAVAWAPSRPSVAYAVGDDGSLWQSTNGGLRWTELTRDSAASARRITAAGYRAAR